jgi:hypothetical protein
MTNEQLRQFNYLLNLAAEETSTRTLRRLLEVVKAGSPSDNGGLEELGFVVVTKLTERGAL